MIPVGNDMYEPVYATKGLGGYNYRKDGADKTILEDAVYSKNKDNVFQHGNHVNFLPICDVSAATKPTKLLSGKIMVSNNDGYQIREDTGGMRTSCFLKLKSGLAHAAQPGGHWIDVMASRNWSDTVPIFEAGRAQSRQDGAHVDVQFQNGIIQVHPEFVYYKSKQGDYEIGDQVSFLTEGQQQFNGAIQSYDTAKQKYMIRSNSDPRPILQVEYIKRNVLGAQQRRVVTARRPLDPRPSNWHHGFLDVLNAGSNDRK